MVIELNFSVDGREYYNLLHKLYTSWDLVVDIAYCEFMEILLGRRSFFIFSTFCFNLHYNTHLQATLSDIANSRINWWIIVAESAINDK